MRLLNRRKDSGAFEVIVTSMLDINFLLIMFFMMTAQFQRETAANLNLPQEQGEKDFQPDEAGLVINLLADGTIVVAKKPVELSELRGLVQHQIDELASTGAGGSGGLDAKSLKLMVRADRDATAADLNRVVRMLHEEGVGTIRIATETPI